MATVVTSKGRDIVTGRLKGSGSEPLNVGWGIGGIAGGPFTAAVTDVGPFSEASESRVAGTSTQQTTTTTNDTYQVTGTITAGGTKTIAEVFLTDSTTKPFATTVAAGGTANGSAVGTSLNTAASYTPGNNTFIQVRTEVLQVTAGTGSTALTVTRAQNGSSAISTIATGDQVTAGNPPNVATVTGGSMFLHGDFTGIALNTNDSIAFTVKVQFT